MQEQYSNQKQSKLEELVLGKKWEEAEQMLSDSPKSKDLMMQLVDLYGKLSLDDEEQYQRFLKLIVQQIDINMQYSIYSETITAIITQLINISSPKYALVIIRGLVAQLQSNIIGRFIVLSNLYLFAELFYGSTFGDLVCIYEQFMQSRKEMSSQIDISRNQANLDVNKIVVVSLSQLLRNINVQHKIISQAKHREIIVFYSKLINNLQNLTANKQYQQVYDSILAIPYEQTLLLFLQKHNIDISKDQLTLPFMKAITKGNTKMSLLSYQPFVLSERAFSKLLLVMVCGQLSNDLNAMPEILSEDCIFLAQAILKICNFLSQQAQLQNYQFLSANTHKIEQFVQKANIFMGAINPKDEIYKQMTQIFVTLNFLPKHYKQRVLSKLIQKHRNQSFKGHLISQYRKLLTFKAPKHIWIRSTPILFSELGQLQPKSSVDYIGHILSFAYYWKEVGNKLVQQKQSIHIDVSNNRIFFGEKLSALRKGLEDRLKVLSIEDKEQQRNQISVCLFRIEQLLTANDR